MRFSALKARPLLILSLWLVFGFAGNPAGADNPDLKALDQSFAPKIHPLLKRYCFRCHSDDRTEADIDLGHFKTLADVRQQPEVWIKVAHMLESRQMPPKKSKIPTDAESAQLLKWVNDYLTIEAEASAGDPGRVVLRRLSNSEYTYTVRDLTGLDSLEPAREFPVDGAAGEGFTNTGDALVMSPSLVTKYLDAAKAIARHAVLLPGGMRWSPHVTRRDWTDAILTRLRAFYDRFAGQGGGQSVNLQGIKFDTNQGGRLAVEKYLAAMVAERKAIRQGTLAVEDAARKHNLNAKYFHILWQTLNDETERQSVVLDRLQARWLGAKATDGHAALAAEITAWQKALWRFNSIGHIGRKGGPKSWMEAVNPIRPGQEFKLKLPDPKRGQDVVVYLAASDAGDGNKGDYVTWKNPRLQGAGQPPLPAGDIAGLVKRLVETRRADLRLTAEYLTVVAAASSGDEGEGADIAALAKRHGVNAGKLAEWMDYLDVGDAGPVRVRGHFKEQTQKGANRDYINGWGASATPSVVSNSSDQQVRIPGIARPHSVVVHPSPTIYAAIGWQSPITGEIRVEASLSDAHPECGNGVEWVLQYRTGRRVTNLWEGDFPTAKSAKMTPKSIPVRQGELVSLIVGPRQGSHACDLTAVDMVITEVAGGKRVWNLAKDVADNILDGNPHADRYGFKTTWHFYKGKWAEVDKPQGHPIGLPPAGSLMTEWQAAKDAVQRMELAQRIEALAVGQPPANKNSPNAILYQHLQSLATTTDVTALREDVEPDERFGKHPLGPSVQVDSADLVVHAPAIVEVRIPAALARGRELVVTGELESQHGSEGSVQLQVSTTKLQKNAFATARPFVATDGSQAQKRLLAAFDAFRQVFPIALCYARIVPVDEVVTLTLFYREDEPLRQLMLNDAETAELEALWDELYFVSHEPFGLVNAYEQITQFATQDRPDLVIAFKPLKKKINERAAAFRERLVKTEPVHVEAVLDFADRAWRRVLTDTERKGLRDLYRRLRDNGILHDAALRLTLARVLTSPAFLYRLEQPASGKKAAPVSDLELASRLSYFLWSSMPDDGLRQLAEAGKLRDRATLLAQTRRMLKDPKTRRMAIEFGCQWLHIRDFDQNDEKNEKLYPEFAKLRGAMYEESVRFFHDLFQSDGSVLGLLNADHTFVNESLAKHYGLKGVGKITGDSTWRRVDGVLAQGRGGILGMATVLAKQSGASRTSPILRGNWVSETLLGERLPRPPPNVPQLPDSVPSGLTARQLIERHASAPECAKCHAKIDPYGFALEQYDAIGRLRPAKVDTKTRLVDGKTIAGIEGLRAYLLEDRRDDFLRQFCRKLLGYALGRATQLSDRPLLAEIRRKLADNGYRVSVAVEAIVMSPQFREIRASE